MSEQCLTFVDVLFTERRRGRLRCRNRATHRSGLCWLHRNRDVPDDDRRRRP